jgi:hypothetical protein
MSLYNLFMGGGSIDLVAGAEVTITPPVTPSDLSRCPVVQQDASTAVSYSCGGTNLYGRVLSISGSTITVNADVTFGTTISGFINPAAVKIDSVTSLVATGSTGAKLWLNTRTGTSLATTISSSFGTSVNNPALANLDATYSVLMYREGTTDTRISIVTNATATANTPVSIPGSYESVSIVALDSTYFACSYTDVSANPYVVIGARSGTTVVFGTPLAIATATGGGFLTTHSTTQASIYYSNQSAPYNFKAQDLTIGGGGSVTSNSTTTIRTVTNSTGFVPYPLLPIVTTGNQDVLFFTDPDDNNYLKAQLTFESGLSVNPSATYSVNSFNPSKPCGACTLDSATFLVLYFEQNLGSTNVISARVVKAV